MDNRKSELDTLILQLYQPVSFWQRLTGSSRENKIKILEKIAATGDTLAVPYILGCVLSDNDSVAKVAAMAVHKLLSQALPKDFIWLEHRMRELGDVYSWYSWYDLHPRDLERFAAFPDAIGSLLGMATFHANGYVREKAVQNLSSIGDGSELPFLLIRINDWVQPVAEAAQKALASRIVPDYANRFVKNFPLVIRLLESKRGEYNGIVQQVFGLIKGPEANAALRAGFSSDDKFVRRMSYQLALESPASDLHEILETALKDNDPMVRIQAIQRAEEILDEKALHGMLVMIMDDPFPQVRLSVLDIAVKRSPENAHSILETALLDKNASVREKARFHLRHMGVLEFATIYRNALNRTGYQLLAAISGLGETGESDDAERLIPFTSEGTVRNRKAALRSIARLNGKAYIPLFIQALMEDQPGIWKVGRNILVNLARDVGAETLGGLYHSDQRRHVRESVLLSFMRLNKWSSLPYLIRGKCESDEYISNLSEKFMVRWLTASNRTFTSPTHDQLTQIRLALDECGANLDDKQRSAILFIIKSFNGTTR